MRWLLEHLPASPPATLLHNDWRLDNMAVAEDDPGRCVAVYDWDMCTLGDPLADLGTLLALWSNRGDAPALSRGDPLLKSGPVTLTGGYLMNHGLTLPWSFPETMWVVEGTLQ